MGRDEGMNMWMNYVLTATANKPKLEFNPMNFLNMLKYMGIGMLVIFVIIGIIILTTVLINKIFSKNN